MQFDNPSTRMARAHGGMNQITWMASIWLALCCSAHAASFDCAKAQAEIDKQICANAALSKLDVEMSSVYRSAMAYVIDPATLQVEQEQWLKVRDQSSDKKFIIQHYQERIHSIRTEMNWTKNEPHYRYRLEYSQDRVLCPHMSKVFNSKFKTPWYRSTLKLEPDPVLFGVPYSQHFERLPGISYDKRKTYDMFLAKYPTSPEFAAVKWREGRYEPPPGSIYTEPPILVAQVDIDNDGENEWIVKYGFMRNGDHTLVSQNDELSVYRSGTFNVAEKVSHDSLYHGQNGKTRPQKFVRTMQLRPFVFAGKTYFSSYSAKGGSFDQWTFRGNPTHEYMSILILTGQSQHFNNAPFETLATDTVCRIRMHPTHLHQ